jgi:hypothetical protein
VLRLRIKDEASNQGGGANMLAPMDGDDQSSCAPVADDSTVRMGSVDCSQSSSCPPSSCLACAAQHRDCSHCPSCCNRVWCCRTCSCRSIQLLLLAIVGEELPSCMSCRCPHCCQTACAQSLHIACAADSVACRR